jgi:hypothetical protein
MRAGSVAAECQQSLDEFARGGGLVARVEVSRAEAF